MRFMLKQQINRRATTFNVLAIITVIAVFLRLYGLGDCNLWGDEIYSLFYAIEPGKSHAYLYFIFMHFWVPLSDSVVWNRIPAAIFGGFTVIPVYHLIKVMSDKKTAILTALFFSLSAFHIGYSQEIRFYSLYVLTASLCILYLFRFLKTKSKWDLLGWCSFGLLTVATHRAGVLVIGISFLIWLSEGPDISRKAKIKLLAGFVLVGGSLVTASYLTGSKTFGSLFFSISGDPRGFIPTNVAKVPLAYFFFLMGETAYPGNKLWVGLCGTIFGFLISRGFYLEVRCQRSLRILLLTIVPVFLLFLVLDMIVPKSYPGAQPKYVIFVLPFLLFLVARGCIFKKQLLTTLFICLTITLGIGNLLSYYSNNYNYNHYKLIDSEGLKRFVSKYRAAGADYYTDTGKDRLQYFPWEAGSGDVWTLFYRWQNGETILSDRLACKKVLIKISRTYRKDLNLWNQFIEALQADYLLDDCFHSHGAQAFLFTHTEKGSCQIERNGAVLFPTQFYSLPYDDMYVNELVSGRGRHFEMDASRAEKSIEVIPRGAAKAIEVQGHLIGCSIEKGGKVGSLIVTDANGHEKKFIFTDGVNIADWKISLGKEEHSQVHFRKRIKLAGRSAHPDAYRDFTAKIHTAIFDLGELEVLKSLELRFNLREGKMVVWGMRLLY